MFPKEITLVLKRKIMKMGHLQKVVYCPFIPLLLSVSPEVIQTTIIFYALVLQVL